MDIEFLNKARELIKEVSLDEKYIDTIDSIVEEIKSNDDFNYIECTLEVTTKKKAKIVSVYNQVKYKSWLNKIIDLPNEWDLSKLFYRQLLYCRVYLKSNSQDLDYICIDQAIARKYPCKHLQECEFIDDTIGIKPYKHIYFYNPLEEFFYIKSPEYNWILEIKYCPQCGTKIDNNGN